jgi:hypothetical protein
MDLVEFVCSSFFLGKEIGLLAFNKWISYFLMHTVPDHKLESTASRVSKYKSCRCCQNKTIVGGVGTSSYFFWCVLECIGGGEGRREESSHLAI